jgi:uncharacterized protein YrzB (UPF0473 family)
VKADGELDQRGGANRGQNAQDDTNPSDDTDDDDDNPPGGGGGGGTPPSDGPAGGGEGNLQNTPSDTELYESSAKNLEDFSQETGDNIALMFMNDFYDDLSSIPSDDSSLLYSQDIVMVFDEESQTFNIGIRPQGSSEDFDSVVEIAKTSDSFMASPSQFMQGFATLVSAPKLDSKFRAEVVEFLKAPIRAKAVEQFEKSIEGSLSDSNVPLGSKLPNRNLSSDGLNDWLSNNTEPIFSSFGTTSIQNAEVGQIVTLIDRNGVEKAYVIVGKKSKEKSMSADPSNPFNVGAEFTLIDLESGRVESDSDLFDYDANLQWSVRGLNNTTLDLSEIAPNSDESIASHERILNSIDELIAKVGGTATVLDDSKRKLIKRLQLAKEELVVVDALGREVFENDAARLSRRYSDALNALDLIVRNPDPLSQTFAMNSGLDKLIYEINFLNSRLYGSVPTKLDVNGVINKPSVDRQKIIADALNSPDSSPSVSVDDFRALSENGQAYDDAFPGSGALIKDNAIAAEVSEFFSGKGRKSLATLSDKALQALSAYASGLIRDNGPNSGNYSPELTTKYMELYRQTTAQYLAFNPNRSSLGDAEFLRDLDFDRLWFDIDNNMSMGERMDLRDEDGFETDFEIIKIGGGQIGNTILVMNKSTAERYIMKREQSTGTANSEIFGAAILNQMGVRGTNYAVRSKTAKDVFISTFSGDTIENIGEGDADEWLGYVGFSTDAPNLRKAVNQVDINNALKIFLFDVLTSNSDRHEQNFKIVKRAPINDSDDGIGDSLLMAPLDAGYAHVLNHLATGGNFSAPNQANMSDNQILTDVEADLFNMTTAGSLIGRSMIDVAGPEAASAFAHMTLAELRDYINRVGFTGMPSVVKQQLLRRLDALDSLIDDKFQQIYDNEASIVHPL